MPDEVCVRRIEVQEWPRYREIPMLVESDKILRGVPVDGGLGGLKFIKTKTPHFTKDLGAYDDPVSDAEHFGGGWFFFGAYCGESLAGGAVVCFRAAKVDLLEGRKDLGVLWDLRVAPDYKRRGIGRALFDAICKEARSEGLKELKIECQNNNYPACQFYKKQGATLAKIDTRAYATEPAVAEETQLIWYLNL